MFTGKNSQVCRHQLDSVFSTFPFVSVADKYVYYALVRHYTWFNSTEAARYENCLALTDSMLFVIEEAGLKREMLKDYVYSMDEKIWYYLKMNQVNTAIEIIVQKKNMGVPDSLLSFLSLNYRDLASWAARQGKYEEAINYYKSALVYINVCKPPWIVYHRRQSALNNIGSMFLRMGEYDSALYYHKMAEKFINENYEMLLRPDADEALFRFSALENVYADIAEVYYTKGNLDQALFYNKNAINISNNELKEKDTWAERAPLFELQAYIWYKKGNILKADSICNILEKQSDSATSEFKIKLFQLKAEIDSIKGNHKSRINNLQKLMALRDQESANMILELKQNLTGYYEATEKKQEIAVKNNDVRIRETKSNAAILSGSFFALLAITLFFNLRRIRQVMKKLRKTMLEVQLQQKQKEEQQLRFQEVRLQAKYQDAVAKQRREISNDLHDSLSGSLVALRYLIDDIKRQQHDDNIKKTLNDIGAEVGSIYTATREYMHSLNAGETTIQHDLPAQLKDLAAKYSGTTSFSISLDTDDEAIAGRLTFYQQDQLFFIIKEAVTNTMKYANASGIRISIGFSENNCSFSIVDDGTGFDIKKKGAGLGLDSMQSRMQDLDGELQIESGKNGTSIKGSFPADDKNRIKEEESFDYFIN